MRIRLEFNKFGLCSGCVYEENRDMCATCERNPNLIKLRDHFKSQKDLDKEVQKQVGDVVQEIKDQTGEEDLREKNRQNLSDWGVK